MADSEVDQKLFTADFVPPLKLMALLSAIQRPAAPEWRGLCEAVKDARANGLEIELIVMVGEEFLLMSIQQEIASDKLTWVTVLPIPDRVLQLAMR